MSSAQPVETKRYFSVDEANKALPLVRVIVGDIVRQWGTVQELRQRLSALRRPDRDRRPGDPYDEELAHSEAQLEVEEEALKTYVEELRKLGVELKGADGLCDFPSLKDGREIYLCWRLGEPEVQHWHELDSGFLGRQSLASPSSRQPAGRR